jgi:Bacterial Ig-like domain/Bacterial Ig domain
MSLKQLLILLSVLALTGCPTRSKGVTSDRGDGGDNTDAAPPSLQITSPASGSYANASVTVVIQAGGSAATSQVSVYVDQGVTPLQPANTPNNFVWDTTTVSESAHTLVAKATVNGKDIESAPITVHVDRTPPTFMTLPAPNSLNVALSDPIQLVFSEALDTTSVTNASVTLSSGGSSLTTTLALSTDRKTITVALASRASLSFPATITESLAATVKDLAGNSVGAVPSWSWTAPLWVQMPVLAGAAPSLALDPHGDAVVSLLVPTSGSTQLSTVRYASGTKWDLSLGSPPTLAGLSVTGGKIAVGADGTPTVAWSQDHIYAAHWNGSSWDLLAGTADASADVTTNPPTVSSLALDSSDAPLVGWLEQAGLDGYGYVAEWSNASWQLLPAGMQAGPGGPKLLVNSTGAPVGLFPGAFGASGPLFGVFLAGSWLQITTPAAGFRNGSGTLPTLALDAQDEPVTLVETLESNVGVLHVEVLNANAWKDLAPSFSTGVQAGINEAYVAVGPDGNPFILWFDLDATASRTLHLARYTGTTWDLTYGPLNGISQANTDATYAALTLDKTGKPTVIWSETDPSTQTSYVYLWKSNY